MFGGLYTKKEIKSLFEKYGLAIQEQLIQNGEIYIPHVGKLYVNEEGYKKVKDFIRDKEFKAKMIILRARPCKQLKDRMKEQVKDRVIEIEE